MPHFPSKQPDESLAVPARAAPEQKTDVPEEHRIRIKNRRQRYLELHPEYFQESHLELADPLLYDRLVRRFQTAAERENEGRNRGYAGVLEANLVRSEARLAAVEHPDPNSPMVYRRAGDGSITAVEQDEEDRPASKEAGWQRWEQIIALRFLRGDDVDFDYAVVDESDVYDHREDENQKKLEEYLDGEDEQFLGHGEPAGQTGIQDF